MRPISSRCAGLWLRLALTFCLCAAMLAGRSEAVSAQVQTYVYQGPSFNYFDCSGDYTCEAGNVTASATIIGMPDSYSGYIPSDWIQSIYISSLGFTLGPGDSPSVSSQNFAFTNGVITSWSIGLIRWADPILQANVSSGGTTESDLGWIQYNTPFHVYYGSTIETPPGFWSNPKIFGIACARPGSASCGEPIDLGSGNMFTEVADYATSGQNPLAFTRTYNSFSNPGTYAVSMGGNWRHGYDRYLHIINPSAIYGVMAERPDGQVLTFSSNSGTYTSDSDVDYSLTVSGSTWTLTTPDDASEIYYSSGGEEGVLQSITQRNLYKQAIIYASGSQIAYVSDSYGRRLGFAYSSTGNLTNVTTPDSLTLAYGYSSLAYTSTSQLTSVTYNTSPATSQTYLYENASYPFALTGRRYGLKTEGAVETISIPLRTGGGW